MNYLSLLRRAVVTFAVLALLLRPRPRPSSLLVVVVDVPLLLLLTFLAIYLRMVSLLFVTIKCHLCHGLSSHVDQWLIVVETNRKVIETATQNLN